MTDETTNGAPSGAPPADGRADGQAGWQTGNEKVGRQAPTCKRHKDPSHSVYVPKYLPQVRTGAGTAQVPEYLRQGRGCHATESISKSKLCTLALR